MKCPYCKGPADLARGAMIYPNRADLANNLFYRCLPCQAWVGCHKGTTRALGRLANAELRQAKIRAHLMFDVLWKSGQMTRQEAYNLLGRRLGLPKHACHIGMFDVDLCEQVIEICRKHQEVAK